MEVLEIQTIAERLTLELSFDFCKEFEINETSFRDAAEAVICSECGSISLIQRKLKIGYESAENLMIQLAAFGIVGEYNRSKPKDVLFKTMTEFDSLIFGINIFDNEVLLLINNNFKNYYSVNRDIIESKRKKIKRFYEYGRYE
jgi:hypothetical protein